MIKYLLKNLNLPIELINIIYSYVDLLVEIKKQKRFRFKRLISGDYFYGFHDSVLQKVILKQEEKTYEILMKNKAYNIIHNMHNNNMNKLTT